MADYVHFHRIRFQMIFVASGWVDVVYEDQVASGTYSNTFWTWRGHGYGHTHHIHVSYTAKAEKDGRTFDLPIFQKEFKPIGLLLRR